MKVVILAGGEGTRISEESIIKPKPMIEIGERPILWHIMKTYSYYGFHDFVICLGYKGHLIKEFFSDYFVRMSDVTFDMSKNKVTIHDNYSEPWKVTLVDTGLRTMTGGRIKKIEKYIDEDTFMMTYGDGVSDVNIAELLKVHNSNDKLVTMTTVQPGGRFGLVGIDSNNIVRSFAEKSKQDSGWINGGFMVLNKKIFNYIDNDDVIFEKEPLEKLAKEKNITAYKHDGFWQCMDTMRDKQLLENLWQNNKADWKIWE